jgi:hypothetical protein
MIAEVTRTRRRERRIFSKQWSVQMCLGNWGFLASPVSRYQPNPIDSRRIRFLPNNLGEYQKSCSWTRPEICESGSRHRIEIIIARILKFRNYKRRHIKYFDAGYLQALLVHVPPLDHVRVLHPLYVQPLQQRPYYHA